MAKYTGPVCRLCRREGAQLYLKGDRCYTAHCPFAKARLSSDGKRGSGLPSTPGARMHKKPSPYSLQLREKQKCKRIYGLMEKQFHKYYLMADKMRGVTGDNMLQLLERRFDNVVYRMGIAVSRAQARQLVSHGHFTVNGKAMDIPSYLVKVGDVIAIKENKKDNLFFAAMKAEKFKSAVTWLEFSPEKLEGKVLALPARADIDMSIAEHLIVELYSK